MLVHPGLPRSRLGCSFAHVNPASGVPRTLPVERGTGLMDCWNLPLAPVAGGHRTMPRSLRARPRWPRSPTGWASTASGARNTTFSTYGYLSRPLMFAQHLAAHTPNGSRVGFRRGRAARYIIRSSSPRRSRPPMCSAADGSMSAWAAGYQRYEFDRLGHTLDESRERFDESVERPAQGICRGAVLARGQVLLLR